MELLILCAGAGEKSWDGAKSDRPLRTKGKRQAQKIGAWMGRMGVCPDIVLTSLDLRARVTAQKALKSAGWTARAIQKSPELSAGTLPDFPDARKILLVGSSTEMRCLLDELGLTAEPELRAGVLLHLTRNKGRISLVTRVDPQDLPNHFPYPAPDGPEQRERPAYYYTQSAVIPYRRTNKGTEILITGSSSGRHWVVPKGIVEPGLSPAASAMTEAREEAGVEGRVETPALGTFSYEKWGASCQVEVFAMEVTNILPDVAWEENHRNRKWVSVFDAASLLQHPAFRKMAMEIQAALDCNQVDGTQSSKHPK
ncbi:MAG: NUDIX domain-containing protein [Roseibium sp.]|uniref:NUDIX domain-containing protein n=1 Tax=Roseibium sp. TaxID=1936156 RepID=UPI002627A904|nr:NUDIX domain-containing protein [Roseibium sp.]MCV0425389.1 NUDIX domain-containing protein [Roseibium sp.]